ncbi:MAG: alpha/beta hydrolase [Bacteroidota bacterium]
MSTHQFTIRDAALRYTRFGAGEKLLIAFHGYGDLGGQVFEQLEEGLGGRYTVCAPDLPWHGQTQWPEASFDLEDMRALVGHIVREEGQRRFELMGHSFGSRLLLCLLSEFIDQVDRLHLLAPDGLRRVIAYDWLPPRWMRRTLIRSLSSPNWLLTLQEGLFRLGLQPKASYNFVRYNLGVPERRERLFRFWMSLDSFRLAVQPTRALIKAKELPIDLYMGRYDRIILLKYGEAYIEGLPKARLQVLEKGHQVIGKELNALLFKNNKELT